ncbi:MAG: biotin--[acetyl-CoA-carboxylase] ligase [Balneolaceae bacterium]|nr:biotin--[acetyl-CoA-carboxylase] ligase [Balneolaceae bacterium]
MFDVDRFKQKLDTQWIGHDIRYFEEIESTSSHLKDLAGDEVTHGMICVADNQTKGRGQYERNWESAPAKNLTFTLAFRPNTGSRLHVLTLACAWATADLVEQQTNYEAYIKWPNDVLINNRKIAGLLTETTFTGSTLDRVLVGIGLNVNQISFSKSLDKKATSLCLERGSTLEREQLLADFLHLIEYCYTLWHKNDNSLLRSINKKLVGYGRWIHISVNGDDRKGKFKLLGVDEKGQLTVINQESAVETFSYEQIELITD